MYKAATINLAGAALACLGATLAVADNHMERPTAFPVEIFTCNYVDGKSQRDLDRVIGKFNQWNEDNGAAGYTAWVLTPRFYNADITFDLAWIGAWQSFETMGAGLDNWRASGSPVAADFDRVMSCDSHTLFRGYTTIPPLAEDPPDNSVVMFETCKLTEGATPPQVYEAHVNWGKWMREKGSKLSEWAFVPDLGSGDVDFDYYTVTGFANYSELSATGELLFNGGGIETTTEMLAPVRGCDNPRVYDATVVQRPVEGQ
jgi:hypothetical protein